MPRKKSIEPKFKNPALNEPIVAPRPRLGLTDAQEAAETAAFNAKFGKEIGRKFGLLYSEFDIDLGAPDPVSMLAATTQLAMKLAYRCVPGMRIVFERPGPGRPRSKSPFHHPPTLLMFADVVKKSTGIESDAKICEYLVGLESNRVKPAVRRKRAKSLANLLAKARTDAARTRH